MKIANRTWLNTLLTWMGTAILLLAHVASAGVPGLDDNAVVKVSTYWSASGVKPGGQITLAVVLDIRPPYHVGSNRAKDPYLPTIVELVNPPDELRSSTPIYPEPHDFEFGAGANKERIQVFSDRTTIYIPMSVTKAAKPGMMEIPVRVSYQACDDQQCLFPADLTERAKLEVLGSAAESTKINDQIFAGMHELEERVSIAFFGWDFKIEPSNFWLLLLVAAVGGFLLNLTPCVMPLIPLKIIGLSQAAGNRRRCFFLGLSLAVGVVAFWLVLATAISTISGFNATNKLFQYPAFTITVGLVIGAMALGMCGFFAVKLPQWVYRINPSQESVGGSFLFGIMTAVLSTPCTAPFMGAAAAWSATQTPSITLSTFAAIGAGMAVPYLILSAFPVLVHRMPRTGPASELIKQVMGLLLFAAGAYFLGTGVAGVLATPPDPPTQAYWWGVALFIAAAGGWLAWRTFRITRKTGRRLLFGGLGVVLVILAVATGLRFTEGSPIKWVYYTADRFAAFQKQQKVIVLEFTAAWCLNCHALEQAVLHQPRVVELLNSKDVAPIKVDITGNNPAGNEKLVEVGRRTIPYLIVYAPNGQPVFSSDAYTVEQIIEAVEKARSLPY